MLDGNHYVECSCSNDEHTLRFTIDAEDEIIYVSTFLNHWKPWYLRVFTAIKYIFGYKCMYGHFDNTLLRSEQVSQLKKVISEYEKLMRGKKQGSTICST